MPQIKVNGGVVSLQRFQPDTLIVPALQHVAHQARIQSIAALITHNRPKRLDLFCGKRLSPNTL